MEECSEPVNLPATGSSSFDFEKTFYRQLIEFDNQHQGNSRKAWTSKRIKEVIDDIHNSRAAKSLGQRRTAMNYYWMNNYDIITEENTEYLIFKRTSSTAPAVRILPREQYFNILSEIHALCAHGGRDKILRAIKNKFYIPRKAVEIFVSLCPDCEKMKKCGTKKAFTVKPVVSCDFNSIGQVDLLDFRTCPDGEYLWLLNYQDNATKYLNLRPLKTNTPVEVAAELMKIFLTFGSPNILQSENDRFTANVINELSEMWPECKNIIGDSQSNNERSNEDVENMLRAWMNGNKSTNWSVGCYFVQYLKNTTLHRTIGKTPYKALFGNESKVDVNRPHTSIPTFPLITTSLEKHLNTFIEREPAQATSSDHVYNAKFETIVEKVEHLHSKNTCSVCNNDVTGLYKCEFCHNVVGMFEIGEESIDSKVTIEVEPNINIEKDNTDKGLKRKSDQIIDVTVKKMQK